MANMVLHKMEEEEEEEEAEYK
jgi:hypothetical protein